MSDGGQNTPVDAFLSQYFADVAAGTVRKLTEYLAMWPDDQDAIAAEHVALQGRPPPVEPVGDALGPYRLEKEIGRGGQGIVYKATDTRIGRTVALKVLRGLGPGAEEVLVRFKREATAASKADHPGVCAVYDAEVEGGIPYIAMRYIEGETLAKRIASTRTGTVADVPMTIVDLDEVGLDEDPDTLVLPGMTSSGTQSRSDVMGMVYLVEKTARALHAVHEAGVIHRDVKPGNVMITSEGEAVVMDFGLARDVESDLQTLTRSGDVFGTPVYMSPEQLTSEGMRPDRRTDVWSLGVMLYECVTLRRPFEAPSREGLYHQILSREPDDPRRLNPSIPRDLATIITTALEKDRDRRYQTALDLAEDLRRVRSYEPTVASPVGLGTRVVRWSQRNPVVAAALVVVLLSLSAGLFISLWQQSLAEDAREDAETERARAETALGGLKVEQASTKSALREAEEARLRATEALTHAEAVKDFLNDDVLGQVSPEDGNKDVLVRDILDKAAKNIEGKFKESPLIEADIRSTIGDTYRQLGRFDLAQPHLERALALRREHLSEEHPGTLASMNSLGGLHKDQARYDLALRLYQKILYVRRSVLGDDHSSTLSAMNNLGALYKSQGKYDLAFPFFEKALEGERRILGEDHPSTLTSMNNLGTLYQSQGKYDLGRPLLEEALDAQRRVLGAEHPSTLTSMNNLGLLYKSQGKYDLALPLYAAALEGRRRVLGEEHPSTLTSMNNLGLLYKSQGKYDLAFPLFEKALEISRRALGADHPSTFTSMNNVGDVYEFRGQYKLALPLYEKVLEGRRRVLGEAHPSTLAAMNNLGLLYQAQGKQNLAVSLYEKALELQRQVLGEDHPNTLTSKNNLALIYKSQGKYDLALPLYEAALEGRRRVLGADHPGTLTSMNNLGVLHMSQGNHDLALPLLEAAFEEQARRLGEDHAGTLTAMSNLGRCLTEQGAYGEAEPLLLSLYSRRLKLLGAKHQIVVRSVGRLVYLYDRWDRPDEAARWRAKLPPPKTPDREAVDQQNVPVPAP